MASSRTYSALKDYLQAQFSGVYPVLDADDIEPELLQGSNAFLAIEELSGDEQLAGFGDPTSLCMRETGTLLVHAFTPSPESSEQARAIVDSVRDVMRLRTIDGIRITGVTPPDSELLNEGLWGAAATAILFDYDSHHSR